MLISVFRSRRSISGPEMDVKYAGEFKDGKEHGQGTYISHDGRKYEGEWKDGKIWNGTVYDKYGNIIDNYLKGVKQ